METQQAVARFWHLPAEAQRIVVELIVYLDREGAVATPVAAPGGAVVLPPIDISSTPTTWPANEFADPDFFGAWSDREDITDSTAYMRQLRQEQWGVKE